MRSSTRPFRAPVPLTAVLVALLSALAIIGSVHPAEAASAAISRTITARANPAEARAGSAVVITGTVSRSTKGSPVRIQRRVGTKWVLVRLTRTRTSAGTFSGRITLPRKSGTYTFRAVAPANGSVRAAVSRTLRIAALKPVTADLGALPSQVPAGGRTTLFGTVAPYVAGTVVSLQRQVSPTRWINVDTVALTSSGSFSKRVPVSSAGRYRAAVPQVGRNAAAYSRTIEVRTTPVIATDALPDAFVGTAYDSRLAAVGDPDGTWTASQLPPGIVLDAATGRLSGTPRVDGDRSVEIGFTQSSTGETAPSKTLTLRVITPTPPEITSSALPAGTRLTSYTATLTVDGNRAGSWTATGLPGGLILNTSTGVISGTPEAVGDTQVQVTFHQTHPVATATRTLPLHVNEAAAPRISTTSLPDGGYGAAYSIRLVAAGDPAGAWTATGLPGGLILNTSTGVISGSPSASGTFSVTVGFTEHRTGLNASKSLPLKVNALPVISTTSLTKGVATRAYSERLRANGDPAGTWTADPLPADLILDRSTGAITGTPTTPGTTQVTIRFTETATGLTATKTLPLLVNQAPVIETAFLPDGGIGNFYRATLRATGSPEGTWTTDALPAGLSLNPTTGEITGTPTNAGNTPMAVTFTQTSTGVSSTRSLSLLVNPRPVIETSSLPDGKSGTPYKNSDGSAVTLRTVGGVTGIWSVSGLPAGLDLDPQTGVISGTPASIGNPLFVPPKKFTVTLNFTQGSTGVSALQKSVELTISPSF